MNKFVTDEMVEVATMSLLGKTKDPVPGIDWWASRQWRVNKVREKMRKALEAVYENTRGLAMKPLSEADVQQLLAAIRKTPAEIFCGQEDLHGPAVSEAKPIDMVLHCPNCGEQHVDADNGDELRIQAAELGVDREGEREYERWIEEREWTNPPHRSHLCAACGHVWRPADVPTNGVQALKTTGTADSPAPVRKPGAKPLLPKDEQQAVLDDPNAIVCLIAYHDVKECEADAMEPGLGAHHMKRAHELLTIGRVIILRDPEIWPDSLKAEFLPRRRET